MEVIKRKQGADTIRFHFNGVTPASAGRMHRGGMLGHHAGPLTIGQCGDGSSWEQGYGEKWADSGDLQEVKSTGW